MKKVSQFLKENLEESDNSVPEYDVDSYGRLEYNIPNRDFTQLSNTLNKLVADSFRFYVKLKGVHWHLKGQLFPELHTFIDSYATEVYNTIDLLAERVRSFNENTIINLEQVWKLGGLKQNQSPNFEAIMMMGDLLDDTIYVIGCYRNAQNIADGLNDGATSNMLQGFIELTENRKYWLNSITQKY